MNGVKPLDTEPIDLKLKERADAIAAVKTQIAPWKERETFSVRPVCHDIIVAYKEIEGIGKPPNLAINFDSLWEQEAVDIVNNALLVLNNLAGYFESYDFPPQPKE